MAKDLSHINSLAELCAEKKKIKLEIEQSGQHLNQLMTGLPGIAFRGAVDTVAGAIWSRIIPTKKRKSKKLAEPEPEPETDILSTLKEVGQETIFFAFSKFLEKLAGGK